MYDMFLNAVMQYAQYIILLGGVVGILLFAYFIVDKRYPKVNFVCIEGNRMTFIQRRLMNEMVVLNDLIKILLYGNNFIGFKISEFNYVYFGNQRKYVATRKGNDLIPLSITSETIEILEIGTGREIAMRYINAIDSVDKNMDKQNPLILAVLSVLPISIILLLTCVGTYLIINDALPKLLEVNSQLSNDNVRMAELNSQITITLDEIIKKVGLNSTTETNQTYYIQKSGV